MDEKYYGFFIFPEDFVLPELVSKLPDDCKYIGNNVLVFDVSLRYDSLLKRAIEFIEQNRNLGVSVIAETSLSCLRTSMKILVENFKSRPEMFKTLNENYKLEAFLDLIKDKSIAFHVEPTTGLN